jgi:hypothetical protein
MVSVKIDLNKKDFVWVGLFVILLSVGVVYAFGGSAPDVMGHSIGELDKCADGESLIMSGGIWSCGTIDTTSAYYAYGGRYTENSQGTCVQVNAHTGGCTCPEGFSSDTMEVALAIVDGEGSFPKDVVFCYNKGF